MTRSSAGTRHPASSLSGRGGQARPGSGSALGTASTAHVSPSALEHRARVLKVPLQLGREGVPNRLESYDESGSAGPHHRWKRKRFSVAGRVLTEIIEALREHGMVPIEADTDGVYFATPQEWSEAEERALVGEIGTTLPSGIRLEYESRYGAMVSPAIKNYALLSYNGELLVRGAAMR